MTDEPGLSAGLKNHSCLVCRQRKIRCDRRNPCSNCVKNTQQCSFVAPTRGKRKRTKPPREGLHAKIKRYEELLKSYGVNIEPCDSDGDGGSDWEEEAGSHQSVLPTPVETRTPNEPPFYPLQQKARLIHKEGSSRYMESLLWPNLESQYFYPDENGRDRYPGEPDDDESNIFLGPSHRYDRGSDTQGRPEEITHPPHDVLLRLLEIFADRVDPLVKILHLPTFRTSLEQAIQQPQKVPSDLQALISSFYLATVASLDDDESLELLGGYKGEIFARHDRITRRALGAAGFVHTTSVTTLTAYCLFLISAGPRCRADSLFVLSGAAVRLARKMGLHRDGTYLGLPPFETEMRRRLWWYILSMDFRISVTMSTQPSLDLFSSDVKRPLNVNDEDLNPGLTEMPAEREGITANVACLLRWEMLLFLRKFSDQPGAGADWGSLANPAISHAKKTEVIKELEDVIETKFLRYCDPTITLHTFMLIMSRASLCKVRLYAHHPRIYADRGLKVPEEEQAVIFTNAKKLLEYMDLMANTKALGKYQWQMGSMVLNALLYVLIEARRCKTGPEVDHLWSLMGMVVLRSSDMLNPNAGFVYDALRRWLLEAWEEHCAAVKAEGGPEPPSPAYINTFRAFQEASPVTRRGGDQAGLGNNNEDAEMSGDADGPAGGGRPDAYPPGNNGVAAPPYNFSNLLSFDADADEWAQWESWVVGEGFPHVDLAWQF